MTPEVKKYFDEFNGYEEADKLDKAIIALVAKHPMNHQSAIQYLRMARVLHTTTLLMEVEALKYLPEHSRTTQG